MSNNDPTALHMVPVFAILFLVGRIAFWREHLADPADRSFGMTMNHVNLLALGHVVYRAIAGH